MKKTVCMLTAVLLVAGLAGCAPQNPAPEPPGGTPPPGRQETPFEVKGCAEMELSGQNNEFRSENVSTPFYTDKDDHIVYTMNALWRRFGNVSDGANAVHLLGNEPSWYEWMTQKFLWSQEVETKERLLLMIQNCPQSANGYVWCWGDREYWLVQQIFQRDNPEKDAVSYHYDGTFRFIGAVYDVLAYQGGTDFLRKKDFTQVNVRDVSQHLTVREKLDQAVDFVMNELNGKNGFIVLPDDMDISPPMEKYALNYGNTGKLGSNSANYWDNYCYGHISAYENALFYEVLGKLYGLETMCGNTQKAEEYKSLQAKVGENYDKYFWNAATGRYGNAVDENARLYDYGLTFQNTEALHYGLGGNERAKSIYSWLNGERTVSGDTSTGADIYAYGLSPRTNTVAIESVLENGKTWWHGPDSINILDGGNASWDKHQTNGGFIFYSEYYDMMARLKYVGPEDFMRRWDVVSREYCTDGLIRKKGWQIGVTAEFPENGIVPMSFIDGLMGMKPSYRGLEIAPTFPAAYGTMGVRAYSYAGNVYAVSVEKSGALIVESENGMELKALYRPYQGKAEMTAKLYDEAGTLLKEEQLQKDGEGAFLIDLKGSAYTGRVQLVVA